jgi:LPS sulfotransferase NodH
MPQERYLILCATQRTGSTMMLDDLLNVAGRWGADGEILRNALFTTNVAKAYPVPDWAAAWSLARSKNRVQHVIVLKVMFHYVAYLDAAIRGALPARRPPVPDFTPERFDAFHEFFRDAIWVSIERRDVFAQAVSMYLAEATQLWEIKAASPPQPGAMRPPPYDRERLEVYLRAFTRERAQWPQFFAHYGITPLRLTYEDAVDNYPRYLDEVFAATSLKRAPTVPERRFVKVGSVINEQYARRLRDETALLP